MLEHSTAYVFAKCGEINAMCTCYNLLTIKLVQAEDIPCIEYLARFRQPLKVVCDEWIKLDRKHEEAFDSMLQALMESGSAESRSEKIYSVLIMTAVFVSLLSVPAYASGDVAGAVESTWSTASQQIKTVVDNVIFPAIDLILAVFFFAKLGTAYFDFRKTGQFEWTAPAILFACLVFTLTAPNYIWGIVGL